MASADHLCKQFESESSGLIWIRSERLFLKKLILKKEKSADDKKVCKACKELKESMMVVKMDAMSNIEILELSAS